MLTQAPLWEERWACKATPGAMESLGLCDDHLRRPAQKKKKIYTMFDQTASGPGSPLSPTDTPRWLTPRELRDQGDHAALPCSLCTPEEPAAEIGNERLQAPGPGTLQCIPAHPGTIRGACRTTRVDHSWKGRSPPLILGRQAGHPEESGGLVQPYLAWRPRTLPREFMNTRHEADTHVYAWIAVPMA